MTDEKRYTLDASWYNWQTILKQMDIILFWSMVLLPQSSPSFMPDALPVTTLSINPGLGQAQTYTALHLKTP